MSVVSDSTAPVILNVHTPTSSFAVAHSIPDKTLPDLFRTLSRKSNNDYRGTRIGPGWLKYLWNDTVWNLDDDSDYTIFSWRQKSTPSAEGPTLYMHDPQVPLPQPGAYRNARYYLFSLSTQHATGAGGSKSVRSGRSKKTTGSRRTAPPDLDDGVPAHKKAFEQFHSENGVRTVTGSIGPATNVKMLLKNGYRHVYVSRKFAADHGFIPADAAPGHYGYGGLINIGSWPIILTSTSDNSSDPNSTAPPHNSKKSKSKGVSIPVYLSEEPHFDVVLGRSFFEKRMIKTNPVDPTDVVCLDTGEKLACELVILKDGRGEIVTVT